MNRGLSRRVVFNSNEDSERFLFLVGKAVASGDLEVHSYSLLTTHFHMLVRSPRAALSDALYRIEKDYVLWFNQRYERDGPLFKGRFTSKPVEGETYLDVVIRYIDFNPVVAGLAVRPGDYLLGSARCWEVQTFPPWLSTDVILDRLHVRPDESVAAAYREVYGRPLPHEVRQTVERRLHHPKRGKDPLPSLLSAASPAVLEWLRSNTRNGDGTSLDHPLVGVAMGKRLLSRFREDVDTQVWAATRSEASLYLEAMVLRTLCRLSFDEAASVAGVSREAIRRRFRRHGALLADREYARWAARVVQAAVADVVDR